MLGTVAAANDSVARGQAAQLEIRLIKGVSQLVVALHKPATEPATVQNGNVGRAGRAYFS